MDKIITLIRMLQTERYRSSEIQYIVGLLARKKCVTLKNIIGRGATGIVYDVEIRDLHLALKLETDTSETKQKLLNEINISQICSKFITDNICINFIYLYGVVRLREIKIELNPIKDGPPRFISDPSLNTYGLFLTKADSPLNKTKVESKSYIDIFWQIAMAVYVLRTQLNIYHNDIHPGNILLKKATRPQTIIYRNKKLRKQKTINIETNEYYAMLADFGVSSHYPLCYTNRDFAVNILRGRSNNLSDFCLTTSQFFGPEKIKSMFPKLSNTWKQLKTVYSSKCLEYFELPDYIKRLDDDYELRSLRSSELEYFEKYAFTEKITHDVHSLNITICDITPPEIHREIPKISLCDDINTKNCIVNSSVKDETSVKGETILQICKNDTRPIVRSGTGPGTLTESRSLRHSLHTASSVS
jgi:hypothetical protein